MFYSRSFKNAKLVFNSVYFVAGFYKSIKRNLVLKTILAFLFFLSFGIEK